jgi:hypothetical protein
MKHPRYPHVYCLLALHVRAEGAVVALEGGGHVAVAAVTQRRNELAGRHVGAIYRKTGPHTRERARTVRSVADECDAAGGPTRRTDLDNLLEVEVVRSMHAGCKPGAVG